MAAEPDYVALGPIYPTTLKAMPWPPQGLARIGEWRSKITCPLVAIGGITLERAPDVLASGASSAAVVTDIVMSDDPEQRTRDWIAATAPWRHLSTGLSTSLTPLTADPAVLEHRGAGLRAERLWMGSSFSLDPAMPMSEAVRRVAFGELEIAHGALAVTARAA